MSIISDNIARLTAYPLTAPGSVDNVNIQKLRTFSVGDIRRVFVNGSVSSADLPVYPTPKARRSYASVLIP